jgi:hypothetical protein
MDNASITLQKAFFPFRPWQHTLLPVSKPTVAISGNYIVCGIPQKTGYDLENIEKLPAATQQSGNFKGGIGAYVYLIPLHQHNRVKFFSA